MCHQKGKNSFTAVYIPKLDQFGRMKPLFQFLGAKKKNLPSLYGLDFTIF